MQETGGWPTATSAALIQSSLGVSTAALSRIGSIGVNLGVITAVVTNIDATVDGRNLVMSPSSNNDGSIYWNWTTTGNMPPAYIPKR
jgi:hypothetical protein